MLYYQDRNEARGHYAHHHPSLPLTAVFKPTQPTAVRPESSPNSFEYSPAFPMQALHSGYALIGPNDLIWFYIALNVTQAQANKTVDPFFAFASNLTSEGLNISTAFTVPYPRSTRGINSFIRLRIGRFNIASRLINRDTMEHNPQGLADTIRSMGGAIWQYVLVNVMGSNICSLPITVM